MYNKSSSCFFYRFKTVLIKTSKMFQSGVALMFISKVSIRIAKSKPILRRVTTRSIFTPLPMDFSEHNVFSVFSVKNPP